MNNNATHLFDHNSIFGVWIFILSDCVLFATLFVSYAVLHNHTYGSVGANDIATLAYTFTQTVLILVTNLTIGLSLYALKKHQFKQAILWLLNTLFLALIFVAFEIHIFAHLFALGETWQRSAFLSVFFSLSGLFVCHLLAGIVWIIILITNILQKSAISILNTRLICLALYWHFLSIIWLCIFTFVYLMGAI